MPEVREVDVAIVGGGPVGLGLAVDLAQRGVSVTLIERHRQPVRIPKGQNMTQRTGEHFKAWGVSEAIRAAAVIPHEYGSAGVTIYGTLLGEHAYDWLRRAEVRAYYGADHERLPQYGTEGALRGRAAQLPGIDLRFGWLAEAVEVAGGVEVASGIDPDEGSAGDSAPAVEVAIRQVDGAHRRRLRARYLVGCDGSRSLVREAAGIDQDLDDHDRRMVLLVFRSKELHELLRRHPGRSYFNVLRPELAGYWEFFGRVDLGETWFFHAPAPPGSTQETFDFRRRLHEAVGRPFELAFDYIGFWDLRFALARSYRRGPVLIAGDAAHSHPPYGGYGINLGFEDARNLGWKLAATLQGWAGAGLLDSYGAERRPVFASTARDFIARMIDRDREFLARFDPNADLEAFAAAWAKRARQGNAEVERFLPNYAGSPVVCGVPGAESGAVGEHRFAARPGHHLAPRRLPGGGSAFDALGCGFTLLTFGLDEAVAAAFRDAARARGIPLKTLASAWGGEVRDYGAQAVLVRPDHFVAWTGDDGSVDVDAVLAKAVGAA